MRYYHGGVAGKRVGDLIEPAPPHVEDGCPVCRARVRGQVVTVRSYRAWLLLQGTAEADRVLALMADAPADGIVDAPRAEASRVYFTPDLEYARFYASRSRGDLYRVEPVGDVTRSTEDHFDTYTAARAVVVEVVQRGAILSRAQRRDLLRRWRRADKKATNGRARAHGFAREE